MCEKLNERHAFSLHVLWALALLAHVPCKHDLRLIVLQSSKLCSNLALNWYQVHNGIDDEPHRGSITPYTMQTCPLSSRNWLDYLSPISLSRPIPAVVGIGFSKRKHQKSKSSNGKNIKKILLHL